MLRRLRLLFLILSVALVEAPAFGQSERCFAADDCSALRLLILRDSAVACPGLSGGCADPFSHVTYRVYLRYEVDDSTPDSLLTFDLAHRSLNTRVQFTGYNGRSHIDLGQTRACFLAGPGAAWDLGEKVLWDDRTANEIALDFLNPDTLPDCGAFDARIAFSPDPPANAGICPMGKKCAYAYLFPVIVRTVPGDTVRLVCAGLDYVPAGTSGAPCSPSSCAIADNNGGHNGIFPHTVPTAPAPAGDNADLLVRLTDTWNSPDVDNSEALAVEIVNTGSGNVTARYLEFAVNIGVGAAIADPLFAAPFGPPLSVEKAHLGGNSYEYRVWYALAFPSGLTLSPNAPVSLDTLTIGRPMPFNQYWEGEAVLVDGHRSRVRSDGECSRLGLSGDTTALASTGGTPPCDKDIIPETVHFTIRAVEDTTGGRPPPKALIGFYLEGDPGPIELVFDGFGCVVDFDLGGSLSIVGVNFANGWSCTGSCPNDCYSVGLVDDSKLTISLCHTSNLVLDEGHPEAFLEVEFEGSGCINRASLEFLSYLKEDAGDHCVPVVDNAYTGFPACGGEAKGRLAFWPNDEGLEDATVSLRAVHGGACDTAACPTDFMLTNVEGRYALCPCVECDSFSVTPYKNNDPLNGVSTFDLTLINKHILGIELLNSPYKMIAADVNNSGGVTTFDLVQLRKLILGIFTNFDTINPDQKSWRFIHTGHVFPNPSNPFQGSPPFFPETGAVSPNVNDFVAIKIGDVNGNAVANGNVSRPASSRPELTIAWPMADAAKAGKTLTVPVVYTGAEPLQALQLGLRFDPALLALVGPSKGDLPAVTEGSFGLTRADKGEIRWLWLPDGAEADQYVVPGTTLFHLTFDRLAPLPDGALPLRADDALLECLAWGTDDTEYALRDDNASEAAGQPALLNETLPRSQQDEERLRAACRPNPTAADAVLGVFAPRAGPGRVALFDAFGKLVFMRKVDFSQGEQDLPMPEAAGLIPGVYVWRVYADGQKISGHLVKH